MRSLFFALFLLPAAGALGQSAPGVRPAPEAQPGRQFRLSTAPQVLAVRPPQTMPAQNGPPLSPYAGAPNAKTQPIPTQWPNAKFELIPTQWPNARIELVGGAGAKQETPVPANGATLNVIPISSAPHSPHK